MIPVERDPSFLAQIKRHEGAVLDSDKMHVAYVCPAGALTIGYGHNLDANPILGLSGASRLTEGEAISLLKQDCAKLASRLDMFIPWWRNLASPRQAVILDMAYNMGVSGVLGFRRMLEAVQNQDWESARGEMLNSRWARQVGRRAPELAMQMLTGEWQG